MTTKDPYILVGKDLRLRTSAHDKLVKFIRAAADRAEQARKARNVRFSAIETDLLGEAEPLGADCKRAEQRQEGKAVSLPDQIIPLGLQRIDEFTAEITAIVMPVERPYRVTTGMPHQAAANALARALQFQSERYKHRSNVTAAIRDAAVYNLCAIRYSWETRATVFSGEDTTNRSVEELTAQGTKLTHLDPYNIGYEPGLNLVDAVTDATIVYYLSQATGVRLLRKKNRQEYFFTEDDLSLSNKTDGIPCNAAGIGKGANVGSMFEYHDKAVRKSKAAAMGDGEQISQHAKTLLRGTQQEGLLAQNGLGALDPLHGSHTLTHCFVRFIGADYGMPNDVNSMLYEITLLNGHRIINLKKLGPDTMPAPIALGSFTYDLDEGRTASYGEQVANVATLISSFINMHKRASRSALAGGKTLFDPAYFSREDLESEHGLVPMQQQMADNPEITKYIKQLSANVDTAGTINSVNLLNDIMGDLLPRTARPDLVGLDRATKDHALAVIATAPASVLHFATILDDQLMSPIRHGIRVLTLENIQRMGYIDEKTQQLLPLLADEINSMGFLLVSASVLTGIDKVRISAMLRDLINITAQMGDQIPAASLPLIEHHMRLEGLDYDDYMAKVQEIAQQQQQQQQQLQQQQATQEGQPITP